VSTGSNAAVSALGANEGDVEDARSPVHTHSVPQHHHGIGTLAVVGSGAHTHSVPSPTFSLSNCTQSGVGCSTVRGVSGPGLVGSLEVGVVGLGPDLDDKVVQGRARGQDWRTTPLWGLGKRRRLLHDGRASTIQAAIVAHGGEATAAVRRFRQLAGEDRDALLAFLRSL
jgi:hypothetical protein